MFIWNRINRYIVIITLYQYLTSSYVQSVNYFVPYLMVNSCID